MNDEDKLAQLDALDPAQLRPEFREGLARLTRLIFNKVCRGQEAGGSGPPAPAAAHAPHFCGLAVALRLGEPA